jgi:hypothetical protein
MRAMPTQTRKWLDDALGADVGALAEEYLLPNKESWWGTTYARTGYYELVDPKGCDLGDAIFSREVSIVALVLEHLPKQLTNECVGWRSMSPYKNKLELKGVIDDGLIWAAHVGCIDIAQLIIERGSKKWNSALRVACRHEYMDIVALMIAHGADQCSCRNDIEWHLEKFKKMGARRPWITSTGFLA